MHGRVQRTDHGTVILYFFFRVELQLNNCRGHATPPSFAATNPQEAMPDGGAVDRRGRRPATTRHRLSLYRRQASIPRDLDVFVGPMCGPHLLGDRESFDEPGRNREGTEASSGRKRTSGFGPAIDFA